MVRIRIPGSGAGRWVALEALPGSKGSHKVFTGRRMTLRQGAQVCLPRGLVFLVLLHSGHPPAHSACGVPASEYSSPDNNICEIGRSGRMISQHTAAIK